MPAVVERIGPEGYYLGLDLAPTMIEVGRRWASEQELHNVDFRVIANEANLDVAPERFDAVICTFGFAYMPAWAVRLQALFIALRPGGQVAMYTWGDCAFFDVPVRIIARHVGRIPWDASAPGPFALRDRDALIRSFTTGLIAIESVAFEKPVGPDAPEAFWEFAAKEAVGPWQCWPPEAEAVREKIHEDALNTLDAMFPDRPVQLTGQVLVVAGTKAG